MTCERSSLDTPEAALLGSLQMRRRSCRGFLPTPIVSSVLSRAFELAQRSASWCNAQPWEVIVTRGAGTERFRQALYGVASADGLREISSEARQSITRRSDLPMPGEYVGRYKERRRAAGRQLYQAMGILGDRTESQRYTLENFSLFGAPHAVILTSARPLGIYGVLDSGGYLANLMLALESFGIASIAQAALAVYSDFIREFFDLAHDRLVVCGLSIGYADTAHRSYGFRTDRAPLQEVVSWYE